MAEKASGGLSAEEREAVKQRAKELRAQEKAGKSREAGLKAVLGAIAELPDEDRALAEGLHEIVTDVAPQLVPKTYYGMPGYANDAGKIVVFIQPAAKFKTRYSTIAFEGPANLDDGDMWATGFAVLTMSADVKQRLRALVEKAVG